MDEDIFASDNDASPQVAVVSLSFAEAQALSWASLTVAQLAVSRGREEHAGTFENNARTLRAAIDDRLSAAVTISVDSMRYLEATGRIVSNPETMSSLGTLGELTRRMVWEGIRGTLAANSERLPGAFEEFEAECPSPDRLGMFAASVADILAIRADLTLDREFSR